MYRCEGCLAIRYCEAEAERFSGEAAIDDARAADLEYQRLGMSLDLIEARDRWEKGDIVTDDLLAIERLTDDVEMISQPAVSQIPIIAEYWRQRARYLNEDIEKIKTGCHGLAKFRAQVARACGQRAVCGSSSLYAPIALGKAQAGLKPYS